MCPHPSKIWPFATKLFGQCSHAKFEANLRLTPVLHLHTCKSTSYNGLRGRDNKPAHVGK